MYFVPLKKQKKKLKRKLRFRLQSITGEKETSYQLAVCLSLLDIVCPALRRRSLSPRGGHVSEFRPRDRFPPAECNSQLGCDDQHVRPNTK